MPATNAQPATFTRPARDPHQQQTAEHLDIERWTGDARPVSAVQPFGVDWMKPARAER